MLTGYTSSTMCTQKMMLLNCCNFFGLRRSRSAVASSLRCTRKEPFKPPQQTWQTLILTHWCVSKTSSHHLSVQGTLHNPRSPDLLLSVAVFLSFAAKLPSHTDTLKSIASAAVSPVLWRAQQGCSLQGTICQLFL